MFVAERGSANHPKSSRSTLVIVKAAYTSHKDARHGILRKSAQRGEVLLFRRGGVGCRRERRPEFLARQSEGEIHRFMPYTQGKMILLRRTAPVTERLGLLNREPR